MAVKHKKTSKITSLTAYLQADCTETMMDEFNQCCAIKGFATKAEALRYLVREFIKITRTSQEKKLFEN